MSKVALRTKLVLRQNQITWRIISPLFQDYMENYKPFISEGVVSLIGDKSSSQKVKF